jgi:hypothetical protein
LLQFEIGSPGESQGSTALSCKGCIQRKQPQYSQPIVVVNPQPDNRQRKYNSYIFYNRINITFFRFHRGIINQVSQIVNVQNSNSHFENCQVKVKAEVKENPRSFPYFYVRKVDLRYFFLLNLNLNLVKIRIPGINALREAIETCINIDGIV